MRTPLGWLETEPEFERPPVRTWRDWLLAAAVVATALAEVALRGDMQWRPLAITYGLLLALTMLWRRTRPLEMVGLAFGTLVAVDLTSALVAAEPFSPYVGGFVLVLVYSLFRWGTSRQAVIGLVFVLAEWLVSVTTDFTGFADAGGGLGVLLFPAALGASIRYATVARGQHLERARLGEREMLARELHDTVAHHVSAIAVQAQAGQVLAASRDLDGAADALHVIEQEASRTMAEMRSMVGSLRRDDGTPTVLTQRGVDDIDRLATPAGAAGLQIVVEHDGDLDDLQSSIQSALYRVAQESITNAMRHARHATRVHILVSGDTRAVRLSVSDDGERGPSLPRAPGYGIVGMAERVTLLGGTLEAGPRLDLGWEVQAMIPRHGGRA